MCFFGIREERFDEREARHDLRHGNIGGAIALEAEAGMIQNQAYNQGYPPQQGYYPPQQGYYPPQQGYYPPQQGYYPPQQGYPPQY